MPEKIQLVSFNQPNNTGAIDMKMDGSVLEKNSSFNILGLLSLLNFIGALTLSVSKTASKKIEALIGSMKFFLKLICISINLQYDNAWNTVAISGLMRLVPFWNC